MIVFCIILLISLIVTIALLYRNIKIVKSDYKEIFNATTDGIFIHDAQNGEIIDLNSAACSLFGYDYKTIKNKTVGQLSAEELGYTQERALEFISEASKYAKTFEWMAKRADLSNFWVEVALSKVMIRNKECILAVFRDIDKRKKVQEQLDRTKSQLEAAIDSSVAGIIIAEASNGNFLVANKTAMDILDYDPKENTNINFATYVKQWPCFELSGDVINSSELPLVKAIQQGIVTKNKRLKIIISKKKYKYLAINASPIYNNEGKISGGVVVFLDITEQKKIEDSLVQNEKMLSVAGLAAGMAHEINNPLGAILQGIQNINRRFSDRVENLNCAKELGIDLVKMNKYLEIRKIKMFLNGIKEAGVRASVIVNDMLSFTSVSTESKYESNIVEIIDKSISLLVNNFDLRKKYDFNKIVINKNYAIEDLRIICNKSEIEHVLFNLLKNAIHAIYKSENSDKGIVDIKASVLNGHIEIEVKDNGKGISEEVKKHIYEPFYSDNGVGQGVGLGLAVAYFIVTNNHNGRLEVESHSGKGTCFKVILPIR